MTDTAPTAAEPLHSTVTQVEQAVRRQGFRLVRSALRPADVFLDDSFTADDVLDLARLVASPLAYLDTEDFEPEEFLRDQLEVRFGSDLIPSTEELPDSWPTVQSRAHRHAGQLSHVRLSFAAAGLIHTRVWVADWYVDLRDQVASQAAAYEDSQVVERRNRGALAGSIAEFLIGQPEFRATPRAKREPAGLTLARPQFPDLDELELELGVRRAMAAADVASYGHEMELLKNREALAAELAATPAWSNARTAPARTNAVLDFLNERSDGYAMSKAFAERFRDAVPSVP